MTTMERKPAASEARMLLKIASRDRSTFDILVAAPDAPDESICFYAQQIVEKTMKAVLVSNSPL